MAETKKLNHKKALEVRKQVKIRKPKYLRSQSNQFKKFKNQNKWRRPKGYQNKIRLQRKGHIKRVQIGYNSPKIVRGANREGFFEIRIFNINDIKNHNLEKNEVFVIAKSVGGKKRLDILSYAKKNNVKFANVKDIDKAILKYTKKKKEIKKEEKVETKKEELEKGDNKKSPVPSPKSTIPKKEEVKKK